MAGSSFCLGVHLLQTSIAWLTTHLPRASAARDIDWLAFFIGATANGNAIRRVLLVGVYRNAARRANFGRAVHNKA
jgi:hypothetical protein